jgi:hypothetical protein
MLSSAVLSRQHLDSVLAPNAVLREACVPLDANELATLIVVQAQYQLVKLLLDLGLELREHVKVSSC